MILSLSLLLAGTFVSQSAPGGNTAAAITPPTSRPPVYATLPVIGPTPFGGSLISLFSPDDFPAALQGRKPPRGVADLKLFIDVAGRVRTCAINRRSTDDALITATCNILYRRARFTPAADAQGRPTSGVLDVQIDWDAVFNRARFIRGN